MHEFKDPARLTRVAVIAVLAHMVTGLLVAAFTWVEFTSPETFLDPGAVAAYGLAGIAYLVTLFACFVIVGCWIYRASANAHALSEEMTISPGWTVGSLFIPILNLFRPFQGMREAWLASHFRHSWHAESAPALLGWWWGLWLVTNILGNISFRLSLNSEDGLLSPEIAGLDIATAILNVPLCLVLAVLMRRLSEVQASAYHEEVFA